MGGTISRAVAATSIVGAALLGAVVQPSSADARAFGTVDCAIAPIGTHAGGACVNHDDAVGTAQVQVLCSNTRYLASQIPVMPNRRKTFSVDCGARAHPVLWDATGRAAWQNRQPPMQQPRWHYENPNHPYYG